MEPSSAQASPENGKIEDYFAPIEALLREVMAQAGFDLSFAIRKSESSGADLEAPQFVVEFSGADSDLLLERNGALLDALEYVVLKAVRLQEELFGKITFDCKDWRRMRAHELQLTAQMAAERVIETGDPFSFTPMSARERRIIHLALKDRPELHTVSEGRGPERKVVILPGSASKA